MDVLIKKETAICQANDDRVGHMIGGSWTLKTDKHTTMKSKNISLSFLTPCVMCPSCVTTQCTQKFVSYEY
jgi:hypothetical protein